MKKLNKNGFTLVELLVAISVLAIVMIIALPQISNVKNTNQTTKYKKYAESIVSSAKLYTDSYAEDMFGNNKSGCVDVPYSELRNKDLVKDIKLEGATCNNANTYVRVRKANDHYFYERAITCKDRDGKVVYEEPLAADGCNGNGPDTVGPHIEITPDGKDWTKGTDEVVTIKIWDEYGMLENTKVQVTWTKDGTVHGTPTTYDFKNKRYDGSTSSNPIKQTIEIPQNQTGRFILTVKPVDVRDSVGNYQTQSVISKEFKLDNTPPSVPTSIRMYKWASNSTAPTELNGLETYANNTWTNKNVYTKATGSVDAHAGGVYYRYTTTGDTQNQNNIKANYRNIEAQGTSYIKWSACDSLGNCSEYTDDAIIKIDKTAPTCTVTGGNSEWINASSTTQSRTITGRCTSDLGGSGCSTTNASYTYSTDINTTKAGPGGNNVGGYIYDNAGNAGSCAANQTVKIDKTSPTCTNSGGNTSWTKDDVTITGTCTDGGSGCATATVTNTYSTTTDTTTASPGSIRDTAGNTATCPSDRTVKVDKTAPATPTISNPSGGNASTGNFSLTVSSSDGHSGISYWQYKYASTEWYTYPNSASNEFTTTPFTAKRNELVYIRACDAVGNCSTDSTTTIHIAGECDSGYTKVGSYGEWGGCSVTCGSGTKYRDVNLVSTITGASCGKQATQDSATCDAGSCAHECDTGGYITSKSGNYPNYYCTKMSSNKTWKGCSCGNEHTAKAGYYMCQGQCIICGKQFTWKWCIKDYWRAGVSAG